MSIYIYIYQHWAYKENQYQCPKMSMLVIVKKTNIICLSIDVACKLITNAIFFENKKSMYTSLMI